MTARSAIGSRHEFPHHALIMQLYNLRMQRSFQGRLRQLWAESEREGRKRVIGNKIVDGGDNYIGFENYSVFLLSIVYFSNLLVCLPLILFPDFDVTLSWPTLVGGPLIIIQYIFWKGICLLACSMKKYKRFLGISRGTTQSLRDILLDMLYLILD